MIIKIQDIVDYGGLFMGSDKWILHERYPELLFYIAIIQITNAKKYISFLDLSFVWYIMSQD